MEVYSTNTNDVKSYTIEVAYNAALGPTGNTVTKTLTTQFTLIIKVDYCTENLSFYPVSDMTDTVYVAGSAKSYYTFNDVTWTPSNCTSAI